MHFIHMACLDYEYAQPFRLYSITLSRFRSYAVQMPTNFPRVLVNPPSRLKIVKSSRHPDTVAPSLENPNASVFPSLNDVLFYAFVTFFPSKSTVQSPTSTRPPLAPFKLSCKAFCALSASCRDEDDCKM